MRSRCILSKFYIKPQHGRTCFGYNRVVSYRNSTSNHNILTLRSGSIMLYLIEILHQTTTTPVASGDFSSCILSKFYIKPQHFDFEKRINYVVSYRNSTSNHNNYRSNTACNLVVSYRNSTSNHNRAASSLPWLPVVSYRNSTSNHNHCRSAAKFAPVVSYRNSTSNHNFMSGIARCIGLYLIEILHQTTT